VTPEQIAELRRLHQASTQGEWRAGDYTHKPSGLAGIACDELEVWIVTPGVMLVPCDAHFCAAAHNHFPALLDAAEECSRLRERLAAVQAALGQIVCTEGCDKGIIMVSDASSVHYEEVTCGACGGSGKRPSVTLNASRLPCERCRGTGRHNVSVYDNQFFSPLGEALVSAWHLAAGTPVTDE